MILQDIGNIWIMCLVEGSIAWPPHSLDLIQLDFYFWGHVETMMYISK